MNTELKQLLLAYITKSASPSEIAWVKEWIASSEENEKAFIHLYEDYHNSLAAQYQFIDNNKAYKRFLAEQSITEKANNVPIFLRYAAIFLICCSFGLFFYKKINSVGDKNLNTTVKVAKGKKNKMTLPDGTIVYVNAGSTLQFNKSFNKTKRKVNLNGEAYFDIAKSKTHIPFIVDAGGYIVRDIGTVFKIKSYTEDREFEFSVLSGEISVENEKESDKKIFLTKNQSLKISKRQYLTALPKKTSKTEKFKVEKLAPELAQMPEKGYQEWLSGTLTFDDNNFEELINTLEREFDVNIIADKELYNYRYSGAFKNVKSPLTILNIIKETTPISYTVNGKTIRINKLTN